MTYSRDESILIALGWGLASSVSLIIGSCIGIVKLPGQKTRAALMAFGGGALIQAVSVELFGEILHKQETSDIVGAEITWIAIGAGIFGGLLFKFLNDILNNHGAYLRHLNTAKGSMKLLQRVHTRKLMSRLRQVPIFKDLSEREL
eukprot:CAMPEP_0119328708 /NCGR_PEP_ID=MMETSP1333-20130426/74053_1 /TAXON_ID=418940 /ORGANISM="Scyphosphaera apsteinii, Strain RCC1455" /LENGTH=145 /DNA_ID=CAMNT_0007337643 /DNA_START=63 /DNA_END=497 /DNA_ORIENTATION=+